MAHRPRAWLTGGLRKSGRFSLIRPINPILGCLDLAGGVRHDQWVCAETIVLPAFLFSAVGVWVRGL